MILRTVMTASFPLFALYHGKVRAYARKCPAIVKRPNDFDASLFDIAKQHRQIDIAVVEIVQVNNIGLEFVDLT